jgi:hypothetical protein
MNARLDNIEVVPAWLLDARSVVWLLAVSEAYGVELELWSLQTDVWTASRLPSLEVLDELLPTLDRFEVSQCLGCRGVSSGLDLLDAWGRQLGRIVPRDDEPAIWRVLLLAALARA